MSSSTNPIAATAAAGRPRAFPPILWLVAGLVLAFYFVAPPNEVMSSDLDLSNHGTYAWMFTHGKQFGAEVVPMTGPYGFLLYGLTYSGELYWQHLIGDLILKALFALVVLRLWRQTTPGAARWCWLAALFLFLPNVVDVFYDSLVLFIGLTLLLTRTERARWLDLLVMALLGFLALVKGNYLTLSAVTLGAVLLQKVLRRQFAWLPAGVLAWGVAIIGAWCLAGQELAHLPGFVRGTLALTSGYNETMGLDEPAHIFGVGVAIAGGIWALLAATFLIRRRTMPEVPLVLFLAGFSFVEWKHGYVRADGHVHIFFNFALILLPTLWLLHRAEVVAGGSAPWRRGPRLAVATLGIATFLVALAGGSDFWDLRLYSMVRDIPGRLRANFNYLRAPRVFRDHLEAQLQQNRIAEDLPQIRNEIGDGTVDLFGFEQGVLLLNKLNYHPRPMGGGTFNVFNRYLQQLNGDFIRDAGRRPQYQVMKFRSLDNRLPALNDPLTLDALLFLYSPVLIQRDFMLFKARAGAEAPKPEKIAEFAVKPGEIIAVPAVPAGQMLLFTLQAPPSALGWLRSAVYRSALLEAELTTDGPHKLHRFRLVPAMLKEPVLFSPLLEDNLDIVRLYGKNRGETVRSLKLLPQDARMFDTDAMRIRFYTLPRPPAPVGTDVEEIVTYMKYPLHNRTPTRLQTEETGIRELNKEPVTLVHAPGEIYYPLVPGDREVIFSFGLMPQAYDPGRTDGVEFNVEILPPTGAPIPLFQRLLQPVTVAADRGMQRARVYLPGPLVEGSRLRLRTETGPAHNGAWDQSYFTRLQIKGGSVQSAPRFGFNQSVLPPGFPPKSELQVDGKPAHLLHPPAEIHFKIPAGARQVTLGVGILPGAYEGKNQTDGVEFSASWRDAAGAEHAVGHRLLAPVTHPEDRGTQLIELALPAAAAGQEFVLRTGPGPQGNLSWDWAYVQTVVIE